MKALILSFVTILFSATSGTSQNSGPNPVKKKVFLLAGQSNMDGRADASMLSEVDKKRLIQVADRTAFYYNRLPRSPLQVTMPSKFVQDKFNLTHCFGPELFFGIELAEKFPDEEFIFIKMSKGGTSLYGCWNPDWTAEKAAVMNEVDQPKMYSKFVDYIRDVLSEFECEAYEISGMLWVQGEADSGVKKWGSKPAEAYRDNLKNLIERIRSDVKAPEMPFVIFQVGSGKVVEGMRSIAADDSNVYLIPQSGDPESPDFYERNPPPIGHYTARSMKKIGEAFFRVFATVLGEK